MADTQTTVNTKHRQSTGVDPHQGVEVFDTNGAAANRQQEATSSSHDSATAGNAALDDAGFGHADLHNAEVIRGDAGAAAFRSTDLRHSELNSADFDNANRTAPGANAQGANWVALLLVLALILVIILIGSWLF